MNMEPSSRDRIVQSARQLIYTRSYADVGVAEICAHAGVKKGSFYHFFPSKQELAIAMLDDYMADMSAYFADMVQDKTISPMKRISRIGVMIAERQEALHAETGHVPGCPFGNVSSELSTHDEVVRCHIDRIFDSIESMFEALLNEAVLQGDIQPLNAKATAQAMLSFIEGVLLSAKTRNDPSLIRQLVPAIINLRIP